MIPLSPFFYFLEQALSYFSILFNCSQGISTSTVSWPR